MAIINSLAVGKAVKSMGGITYSTQQGRVIAKQKVTTVKDAMSPSQLAQRNKLTATVKLWRQYQADIKQFWTRLDGYNSKYNQFVSSNIGFANDTFSYDPITQKVTQTKFQIARGYFPINSIELKKGDPATATVRVRAISNELRDNLKVGDKLHFYDAEYGKLQTHIITQEDIDDMLLAGALIELHGDFLGAIIGAIYEDMLGRNSDAYSDMITLE